MKFINLYTRFFFFSLVYVVISSCLAFSQSGIALKKYDVSLYPKVTSEIYIFDADKDYPVQSYSTSNLVVLDNGLAPLNLQLTNQPQNPKSNLSINLILDLGLEQFEPAIKPRFQIGKEIIRNLISISDTSKQEIALTSFDAINYLNQGLTNSKSRLLTALNSLTPEASSLLDEAFIEKPAGTIEVHQNSKYDKISILVTDGSGLVNKSQILTSLQQQGIKVFVVVVGKTISKDLLDIALQTQGFYIDNVSPNNDLQLIAKYLFALIQEFQPSIVSYENSFTCADIHDVEIDIPGKGYQVKFNYNLLTHKKPLLTSNPKSLGFSSVLPGTFLEKDILLTAVNSDITISKFSIQDPRFTIVVGNITSDLVVKENESHKLTIRYTPTDSAITFTTLQIASTACMGNEIYLTGGFPNTPPVERTVKLLTPTCNQTLVPGDTFSIVWTGLLPQDVIQLEYSIDNGRTWDTLARNLTDLVYKWVVPNKISDQCLIRAIQLWPNNVGRTLDLKHNAEVNSAFFNNDGSLAVTASADKYVGLWNANSGKIVHWLTGHTGEVKYAVFSHKGDKIASVAEDSNIILWDVTTGKELLRKQIPAIPQSVNFSPDDSKIVVSCNTGCATIFNVAGLDKVVQIIAYPKSGVCWYAEFNPDGQKILTAGNDGIAKVWDWAGDITKPIEEYNTQITGYGNVIHATYNYNATKVGVTSLTTKRMYVFDTSTQDTLFSVTHNSKPDDNIVMNSCSFNIDPKNGERLLTAAQDNVRLWDANTGLDVPPHIIQEHTESIRTAVFNFDAKRILTSSWDFTAKIWNLEQRDLQMDTTDCTFRIKPLTLEFANIDFPSVPVNDSKDSTITKFLINKTDFNFEIKNLELSGNSNEDFQIISQPKTPFFLDTLTPTPITVLFRPTKPGFITDTIKILTAGGTFSAVLTGTGIDRGLFAYSNLIDFGQVELGDSKDIAISMLVVNKSLSDIEITNASLQKPDTTHFNIVSDIENTLLHPNETAGITLRYTPSAIEVNNSTLAIENSGFLSPLKISLLGEGIEPRIDTLTLVAADITGEPGEIIEMPIYIRNLSVNGIRPSITGFETDLRFNSTLLMPLDFFPSYIDGQDKVMKLTLPSQFGPDSILAKLRFKVALGNDSLSKMKLQYTAPVGLGKVRINEKEGLFTLSGYCKEGSPRLFDSEGKIYLNQTFPNPTSNIVSIEYSILETDLTKLYIIDLTGKVVKTIFDGIAQKGEYSIQLNLSDLPSGQYRYILETPTRKLTRSMIIQR